jgi:hypothetical protein
MVVPAELKIVDFRGLGQRVPGWQASPYPSNGGKELKDSLFFSGVSTEGHIKKLIRGYQ